MADIDRVEIVAASSDAWFERLLALAACVVLFAPLVAVYFVAEAPAKPLPDTSAETVGIAVVLRATLQRLFRSGSRSVLQTALGTVSRASARTMTRRVVRVGVKSLAGLLGRPQVAAVDDGVEAEQPTLQTPLWAVASGSIAVAASFAGILYLLTLNGSALYPGGASQEVLQGMSPILAVLLCMAPLPAYALLAMAAAKPCGATVGFRTGWESVILQAYFTGSGSFLPLATDSEFGGPAPARARLALVTLLGMFGLHFVFTLAGDYLASDALSFLGGMFLIYAFVFSFPIAPLDGHHLWARSRRLWLVVWAPILAAFVWLLPERFHAVL